MRNWRDKRRISEGHDEVVQVWWVMEVVDLSVNNVNISMHVI